MISLSLRLLNVYQRHVRMPPGSSVSMVVTQERKYASLISLIPIYVQLTEMNERKKGENIPHYAKDDEYGNERTRLQLCERTGEI